MFNEYWRTIPGDMFDFEEFYNRIAKHLPDNCTIAEVGVADGKSAIALATFLHQLGKKFTLYMIDSLDYGGKDQLRTIINHVIKAGIEGIEIWPYSSLEAADKFPEVHFDFVFIDSSHLYEDTKKEIVVWYKKIKENGILAGHDVISHDGVRRAIHEVIPTTFSRKDVPGRKFPEERVLQIENTSRNFGVWFVKKKWYLELNA